MMTSGGMQWLRSSYSWLRTSINLRPYKPNTDARQSLRQGQVETRRFGNELPLGALLVNDELGQTDDELLPVRHLDSLSFLKGVPARWPPNGGETRMEQAGSDRPEYDIRRATHFAVWVAWSIRMALRKFLSDCTAIDRASSGGRVMPSFLLIACKDLVTCQPGRQVNTARLTLLAASAHITNSYGGLTSSSEGAATRIIKHRERTGSITWR